jgi:hypothetical protein
VALPELSRIIAPSPAWHRETIRAGVAVEAADGDFRHALEVRGYIKLAFIPGVIGLGVPWTKKQLTVLFCRRAETCA